MKTFTVGFDLKSFGDPPTGRFPPPLMKASKTIPRFGEEPLPDREDERTEFKSSFGREVIETLAAFANSKGGTVYIGISPKLTPVSLVVSEESLQQWINQIKSLTIPSIVPDAEMTMFKGRQIVLLTVPAYPVRPVCCQGKYFKRVNNSNHLMTLNEIADEHLKSVNTSWDFSQSSEYSIDAISLEKVLAFMEDSNRLRSNPIYDDPLTVLRKFELVRERPTFGCLFLFSKAPLLLTTIEAGRFSSPTLIKDGLTIRDDLFAEVNASLEFIKKHTSKRYVFMGKTQRAELWEYPLEALREIIINMIVHRDYRAPEDSSIKVFDTRIEFFNPGGLPEGVLLADIISGKVPSMTRNKQIAGLFKEAGLIEKYGSGIKRVSVTMEQLGAPPPLFETLGGFFKVTLFPVAGVSEGVSEGVNEGVNELLLELLSRIEAVPGLRLPDLSKHLSVSPKTVERWLRQLRLAGKIEFRGSPKRGGYYAK